MKLYSSLKLFLRSLSCMKFLKIFKEKTFKIIFRHILEKVLFLVFSREPKSCNAIPNTPRDSFLHLQHPWKSRICCFGCCFRILVFLMDVLEYWSSRFSIEFWQCRARVSLRPWEEHGWHRHVWYESADHGMIWSFTSLDCGLIDTVLAMNGSVTSTS